jgi:hypothetical protein
MAPDYLKSLKHVEPKKKEVQVSEEDKKILEKHMGQEELKLSTEQKTILEIIDKRKTVNMITREYNLALKPLGKDLVPEKKVLEILNSLKNQDLVKSVKGTDGQEYWVDIKYYREKLLGTEKL